MENGNWHQVRRIFDDALRQEPKERLTFVTQACASDTSLLQEVESLLRSLDSADNFLETPAVETVANALSGSGRIFQSGRYLRHYKIIRELGSGGMGEVYLANDTKLNRRVALKVLHQNLLSDSDASGRLLREAQAAAKLDHPHICQIHEISETDDRSFIVMQYIEGETLADALAKGLTAPKALDLAIQIADALAEAHSHRIIHRDIKPANIIINDKSQAKVLDFGLAKFIEAENQEDTLKRLETSGAVMGTVPYMSPEQLRGKHVDARTDIFSFGALFFEMLTGRQAFGRESNAETTAAILGEEPDVSLIPVGLLPIVRKSLMKDRDLRYQSATDLAEDLRVLQKSCDLEGPSPAISTLPTQPVHTTDPAGPRSRQFYFWQSSKENNSIEKTVHTNQPESVNRAWRRRISILAPILFFFVLGIGAILFWQIGKSEDLHSFDKLRSTRLVSWKTAGSGSYSDYQVSHDGKMLAYSSNQEGPPEGIFVKQTPDGGEIRVTKDAWNNVTPIWSPDDQKIAFASMRGDQAGIYMIPALGGAAVPLKILGHSTNVSLRHWSKNNETIFYEFAGNLFRLDIATKDVTQITNLDFTGERYFSISPDEDKFAYVDRVEGQADLWTCSISNGSPVRLTNDKDTEIRPRWHPDGRRILYSVLRNNYHQVNVAYTDARTPGQVTRGDSEYRMIDVSGDGTKIYYLSQEKESDIWGVGAETGEEFEVAAGLESEYWPDVSPDGLSIAYQTNPAAEGISFSGNPTIVIKSLVNRSPPHTVKGYNPRWLPDGRRLALLRWEASEQKFQLWVVNTINGEERQITTASVIAPGFSFLPYNRNQTRDYTWSRDGSNVVYLSKETGAGNVLTTSLNSGETVNLTNNTDPNLYFYCPLWSASENSIAFMSQTRPASKDEKPVWKIWMVEQYKLREIYASKTPLRLLGWSAEDELVLEESDTWMAAQPMDVRVSRVSLSGQKRFEVLLENVYATSMSLSADGKLVTFTARQDNKDNIWLAPTVGGGGLRKITTNGNSKLFYGSPAISADGKTIFFDKQEETKIISRLENFE